MIFWFEMIDEFCFVINDRRLVLSNADILIRVATSVIEYGLLQSTFILATVRYDMMAAQRWILTAFSVYPHRVFTVMLCLIHLKNTSISHRWRYKLDISKALTSKLLDIKSKIVSLSGS